MSDNRCLRYREDEEEEEQEQKNDEECDETNEKKARIGAQKATGKNKRGGTKKARVELTSANIDVIDVINMIETYDRPGSAYTESNYARSGTYAAALENEPGQRIPKAGAYETRVGRARAELRVLEAEARGPNASAGAEISVFKAEARGPSASVRAEISEDGTEVMARAELASISVKSGPVQAKVGLGLDTGASAGLGGMEVKFLGTGFSVGSTTGVSILGSEVKVGCAIM